MVARPGGARRPPGLGQLAARGTRAPAGIAAAHAPGATSGAGWATLARACSPPSEAGVRGEGVAALPASPHSIPCASYTSSLLPTPPRRLDPPAPTQTCHP